VALKPQSPPSNLNLLGCEGVRTDTQDTFTATQPPPLQGHLMVYCWTTFTLTSLGPFRSLGHTDNSKFLQSLSNYTFIKPQLQAQS